MEADWQAMSQYHSGDLLNRMDNDVASVSSSVLGWLPDLVTRLGAVPGGAGNHFILRSHPWRGWPSSARR